MSYSLSFNLISKNNQLVFRQIANQYDPIRLAECGKWVETMDVKNVSKDYALLLTQIGQILTQLNIAKDQKVVNAVNMAIGSNDYKMVKPTLSRFGLDTNDIGVSEELAPRIMELGNIRRCLQFLNDLPGTSGKSVNIINLPEFG